MARPVNAQPQQTRANILAAASELFAASGYDGTTVRRIAARAGVSLGMIRHYFGSKTGLYDACMDVANELYGQLAEQIGAELASGGAPNEVAGSAVRTAFRYAVAHRAALKLTLWDLIGGAARADRRTDEVMLPFVRSTARAFASALGRPPGELALATRTLIYLVARYATAESTELRAVVGGGQRPPSPDAALERVEEHLVDLAHGLFAASSGAADQPPGR